MSDGRERSVSRRRTGRRSGITDLAFAYPMLLSESIQGFGGSMWRGRLEGADILELLGDNEEERIETVVEMLRQSSDEEINEFLRIGQTAVLQVSQERARQATVAAPEPEEDDRPSETRRPRSGSSIERRRDRRRSSYWLL